ncbi:MAG: translation elongation factor Ts [Trueperaceae bacterium]|nr:translation elongation factor Ts [Trueperaceae bacterium]MCC6310321.1 translation elongation factor Ts [Trueperaceae bacterium]MCW5819169.1 translation elongation factor Ts [Trueperaceae bacterium]
MAVSTEMIKQLRAMTGAGMLDVKKALEDAGSDLNKAAELLRERGIAKADKKADRAAKEGLVGHYLHHNGKIAVIVEVNCETDFVARNERFQELARNLAMHIAMASPAYTRREDVPEEVLAAEKHALQRQVAEEGKPANVAEKIVDGRLNKYLSEIVLLDQAYIKDDKKTIDTVVKEAAATLGENIQVGRFARIAVGE